MPDIQLLTTFFLRSQYCSDYRLISAYLIRLQESIKGKVSSSLPIYITFLKATIFPNRSHEMFEPSKQGAFNCKTSTSNSSEF